MLRSARYQQVISDRRQSVRIYHGIEIEGGGGSEVLGGEYLKGVIVGAGEEGERVKGVK